MSIFPNHFLWPTDFFNCVNLFQSIAIDMKYIIAYLFSYISLLIYMIWLNMSNYPCKMGHFSQFLNHYISSITKFSHILNTVSQSPNNTLFKYIITLYPIYREHWNELQTNPVALTETLGFRPYRGQAQQGQTLHPYIFIHKWMYMLISIFAYLTNQYLLIPHVNIIEICIFTYPKGHAQPGQDLILLPQHPGYHPSGTKWLRQEGICTEEV